MFEFVIVYGFMLTGDLISGETLLDCPEDPGRLAHYWISYSNGFAAWLRFSGTTRFNAGRFWLLAALKVSPMFSVKICLEELTYGWMDLASVSFSGTKSSNGGKLLQASWK
jgi:hypothetical protein